MLKQKGFAYEVTRVQSLSEQVSQFFLCQLKTRCDDTSSQKMPSLSYAAGQYVGVLHQDARVSFLSIACAPRIDQQLEFHVFHPPQNNMAQDLLHLATVEKRWILQGPFGDCTANKLSSQRPIIFLARGTGFAPVKAVIEAIANQPDCPSIFLYWFIPHAAHFYLVDLLEAWEHKLPDFSYDLLADPMCGEMSFAPVIQQHRDFSNVSVYMSGSAHFARSGFAALEEWGMRRELFMSDVF